MQKNNLPEPGTLWTTLYAMKNHRVLTSDGEFLSDDEFNNLRYTGNVHRIQEENLVDGQPAIYEIAPATRNELQELFEITQTRVQNFYQQLMQAVERHVETLYNEITHLAREIHRYKQVITSLKQTISQEIATHQQKNGHQRDTNYSAKFVDLKRSLTNLMEIEFEIRICQTLLTATELLQQSPNSTWKSDTLAIYINRCIECRTLLEEDNEKHPYLSLLAEKIFAGKAILFEKRQRILSQVPAKNLRVKPRRKRRPAVAIAEVAI